MMPTDIRRIREDLLRMVHGIDLRWHGSAASGESLPDSTTELRTMRALVAPVVARLETRVKETEATLRACQRRVDRLQRSVDRLRVGRSDPPVIQTAIGADQTKTSRSRKRKGSK